MDPTFPFVGRSGETAHCTGPRERLRAEASRTLGAERPSSVETAGVGVGRAASGGNCPSIQGSSSAQRLAFCPQTLDALCLTLVMLEPRPPHPLRPADPQVRGPKDRPPQASTPELPVLTAPAASPARPLLCAPEAKVPGALVLGPVPASPVPAPGVHPPGPPPHTRQNPGRAELEGSTTNISGAPEKPGGVLTTRMGGPGPGLGPVTWKAQASTRQEGLQACRCPRRPTRAGSSGHSASLEFTYSQELPPQPSSPESPVESCPQPTQELNQGLPAGCLGSEPRPGGWVGNTGPQQGLEVRAGLQLYI